MSVARFIALEGIDGSGTSSQRRALADELRARGHTVLETQQPSRRSIGRLIRARLDAHAEPLDPAAMALLFAADRLDHVRGEIAPALDAGQVVVCDRYVVSSWAYQSQACDPAWVRTINRLAPWPDLTLVLDVPVEVALERVRARLGVPREIYETEIQQRRIAAAYHGILAEDHPAMVRIDGTPSPETVTAAIVEACQRYGL